MRVKDTQIEIQDNETVIELDSKLSFVKVETTGFQALCNRVKELEEENKKLKAEKRALKKDYDEFYEKEYMARIEECNRLFGELFEIKHMDLWEFAAKYCNDDQLEEAGHQLARSLGVGQ